VVVGFQNSQSSSQGSLLGGLGGYSSRTFTKLGKGVINPLKFFWVGGIKGPIGQFGIGFNYFNLYWEFWGYSSTLLFFHSWESLPIFKLYPPQWDI